MGINSRSLSGQQACGWPAMGSNETGGDVNMTASLKSTKKTPRQQPVAASKAAPAKVQTNPRGTSMKRAATGRKANGAAISDAQRRNYIEVAAYYIAERRGFHGDSTLEDWAQAEREVDRMLRENRLNS
jgi:hypothetical protein